MPNYILLESIELTQNTTSVIFDNIPQTGYTDLKIVASVLDNAEDWLEIQFNSVTSGNSMRFFRGNGTNTASSTNAWMVAGTGNSNTTANTFSNCEFYIPNYSASGVTKTVNSDWTTENNGTANYMGLAANISTITNPITSIKILNRNTAIMQQYSTFYLYGLAAVGTTPVIAPKAIGGNVIANDGTYWYHAFTTSGIFNPKTSLSCDALLVAGGGAGGWDLQGGGGAGGVVASNSAFSISTAQSVIVGAGGNGGVYTSVPNTSGSDTVFNSWTALGGGKGNSTGGSGGGAGIGAAGVVQIGKAATQTSPSGATGYGNAGGNSIQNSPVFATGGGGGAGAAGSNYSGSNGGAGGAGKNTWATWLTATNTGVSGYIAGGGGGGVYSQGTSGAGGSGGGGAGWTGAAAANPASPVTAAMHGVMATGGGGGGAGANFAGGNGGSGIVIIRYPMA